MRHGLTAAIAGAVVLLAGLPPASTKAGVRGLDDEDYAERDEINQTYTLSPGASVRVNDIAGPVEIETWSGDTAEVHIVRSARTREELEQKKIIVEHTASSLAIYTEPKHGLHWDHARVRQHVTLKLPQRIGLQVTDVAGHVSVGEIDGDVRINDVAGALEVSRVNGSPHINDIAGSVTISVGEVGAEGIHINDIAGRVELVVSPGTNADLEISDISGHIEVGVPNVSVVGKIDPENFRGKIGEGGPRITISDIAGSVTVRN